MWGGLCGQLGGGREYNHTKLNQWAVQSSPQLYKYNILCDAKCSEAPYTLQSMKSEKQLRRHLPFPIRYLYSMYGTLGLDQISGRCLVFHFVKIFAKNSCLCTLVWCKIRTTQTQRSTLRCSLHQSTYTVHTYAHMRNCSIKLNESQRGDNVSLKGECHEKIIPNFFFSR